MLQTEKEYAQALYMLAAEEGMAEEILTHLKTVRDMFAQNPEYLEFLSSPAIEQSLRLEAIDEAFGTMPEYVCSFIKLLCENGRISLISDAIKEYEKITVSLSNRVTATVYSAVPLTDGQKQKVISKLCALSGKNVDADYIVDPEHLGGLKIEMDGKTYDGSLKSRLSSVKDVMLG